MKLAVISDIHANEKAFLAFLEQMKKEQPDGIICLGDYVTDCPYPRRTLELLQRMRELYPCYLVRGNREEYLIQNFYHPQGWQPGTPTGSLHYTMEQLGEEDIRFFESLEICDRVAIEDYPVLTICHGTPWDSRGNFELDPLLKDACMQALEGEYLLGGHNHHQEVDRRYGKVYVNPGALGMAIDGVGGQAPFALLHGTCRDGRKAWEPELCSIPYDLAGLLADFEESGLNTCGSLLTKATHKTLSTGVNYFLKFVMEAERLSGKPAADTEEEILLQVAERLEL